MSFAAIVRRSVTLKEFKSLVGGEIGASRWFDITQARIDAFADVTEDRQFLHIDPEAAKRTPFGGTIAHGFLTLSMLSAMAYDIVPAIEGAAMGVNYGFDRIRFVAPVRAGARIRARFRLLALTHRSAREYQPRYEVTVEIEGSEKPALVAEWLSLVMLAPAIADGA
jgi:acyl dehydratase